MAAISANNLTKKFQSFTAVDNLSFEIPEHHVVGFLGPNGAGKTTTLRMLVGLSEPTNGKIEIAGSPMEFGKLSPANYKIGYLPELPSMYGWMSGYEYLKFIASTFNMPEKIMKAKISKVVTIVDLKDSIDKKIATFSGGMKQRLGIAQALLNDPEVLILDEPVSALDPIGRKEILEIIKKLKKNRTVLFSTHILSDVDKVCDDVIIINHGKLVVSSPLNELKAKYATPILEVDFVNNPKSIIDAVKKNSWASKVIQDGNKLKICLTDESIMENNLPLKFFATQNIGIQKYFLYLPETEDLFIKLLEEKS